jgi:hypothetical protein
MIMTTLAKTSTTPRRHVARIATMAAVSLFAGSASGLVSPTAQAATALPKCDAARKGQIVGSQVCSVKNGTYRWVKVVATTPATIAKKATTVAPKANPDVVPAGFTRHRAADNSWAITVPNTWNENSYGNTGRTKGFIYPTGGFSLTIGTNATPIAATPEKYLAEQVAQKAASGIVVDEKFLKTLGDLPTIIVTSHSPISPSAFTREVAIFRKTGGTEFGVVYLSISWANDVTGAADRKVELDAMLNSAVVKA